LKIIIVYERAIAKPSLISKPLNAVAITILEHFFMALLMIILEQKQNPN